MSSMLTRTCAIGPRQSSQSPEGAAPSPSTSSTPPPSPGGHRSPVASSKCCPSSESVQGTRTTYAPESGFLRGERPHVQAAVWVCGFSPPLCTFCRLAVPQPIPSPVDRPVGVSSSVSPVHEQGGCEHSGVCVLGT